MTKLQLKTTMVGMFPYHDTVHGWFMGCLCLWPERVRCQISLLDMSDTLRRGGGVSKRCMTVRCTQSDSNYFGVFRTVPTRTTLVCPP
jgi:hypothetical protein